MDDSAAWCSSFFEEATGQSSATTPEQNKVDEHVKKSVDKKKPDDDDGDGSVAPTVNSDVKSLSEGGKEKTSKIVARIENPAKEKSSESEDEDETKKSAVVKQKKKMTINVKQNRTTPDDDDGNGRVNPEGKEKTPLIPPPGIILRIKSEFAKPSHNLKLSDCKFTCTHTHAEKLYFYSIFSANRQQIF
jgi:hypothetical protein